MQIELLSENKMLSSISSLFNRISLNAFVMNGACLSLRFWGKFEKLAKIQSLAFIEAAASSNSNLPQEQNQLKSHPC